VIVAIVTVGACRDRAPSKAGDATAPAASASATPDANATAEDAAAANASGTARGAFAQVLGEHRNVATLDEVPQHLPRAMLKNFVLKHGRVRTGERGHLVEQRVSQSADPVAPRAILWDDATGTVVTYNGGTREQTHGQRLDVLAFDDARKAFDLAGIEPGAIDGGAQDCTSCHGASQRPIFSMYPDWPSFYGSDNDELSNVKVAVQVAELADYRRFIAGAATRSPRYAPLFAPANVEAAVKREPYETFPYRPDLREDIHAPSRAFAFRPGLRLGVLLNRLQARSLARSLVAHPRYATLGRLFLANLVRCRIGSDLLGKRSDVEAALGEHARIVGGAALHYRQAWKLFDLEVRDVDIRYSYAHDGYRSDDASKNPMAVGYIGTYWNSYFDGSATIDELVALALYEEQAARSPELAHIVTPDGLRRKYEPFAERYALDAAFFAEMDHKGQWLPIPYPKELNVAHHRDGWPAEHRAQHEKLCAALGTTAM
jgi:hypothetical protein